MALVKDTFCKFRLSTEHKTKLKQMAAAQGLSEGELILRALGFVGETSRLANTPDPKKEPGAAGIQELANRMANKRRKK